MAPIFRYACQGKYTLRSIAIMYISHFSGVTGAESLVNTRDNVV